ncbi:MAG: DnaD domain protein [Anaerolineaceae bacterium]|nr:DnaD domain protein [Anaerolineaceae bacterium]
MKVFSGFSKSDGAQMTSIPSEFFINLLPLIENLFELKVILYAIWFLEHLEGKIKFIRYQNFVSDDTFLAGMGGNREEARNNLNIGLQLAVDRNSLLKATGENQPLEDTIYFINTPRGRAALKGLLAGSWQFEDQPLPTRQALRPNIFKLYEANIGPLTPMIAETLQEAEETYPMIWIEQAIRIAVENNVRRWRYVEAILSSWKERGRDEKDRRDTQEDSKRFLDGEFGQFFKTG